MRSIPLIFDLSMKMFFIRVMQILLIIIVLLIIGELIYMRHTRFGAEATGERLARMESKSNYSDGVFDNLEPTPALAGGTT